MLQYIYMNKRILAPAYKQLGKVTAQNMKLVRENDLVALEDRFI